MHFVADSLQCDSCIVDFMAYDTKPVLDDNIEQVAEQVMTDALKGAKDGSATVVRDAPMETMRAAESWKNCNTAA
jgi:hypothetical protein